MRTIDAVIASRWLQSGEAILLDVREPEEYAQEHIADAVLLPLGEVSAQRLPPLAGKKLVVQCHLGVRSAHACNRLLAENPAIEAYNLTGGIEGWKSAGLPVVHA
jgi:rhodanese-related sulfurtransferase